MMDLSAVPPSGDGASGVTGNQQPGAPGDIAPTPAPLEGELILPQTVRGLIAGSPQLYGGDQISSILSAILNDSQCEKEQARRQVAQIQASLDDAKADLFKEQLKNKGLSGQLNESVTRNRWEKLGAFLSPVAFSIAIDLFKAKFELSVVIGLLGLALLAASCWRSKGNTDD